MKLFMFFLLTLIFFQHSMAQHKMGVVSVFKNNREGRRKALVLANQEYTHQPSLQNTLRDADSMAVALRYIGFEEMLVKNKTLVETQDAIDQFVATLQPGDVVFIYYSGHGLGYLYDNFLLPTSFDAVCTGQIENRAISLRKLILDIQNRSVRNLFVVVDACRNQSFGEDCPSKSTQAAVTQLMPPEQNPNGTLLAFATDYGQTASYLSRQNRNSLYTESLLIYLRQPLELQEIFTLAARRTYQESLKFHQYNDKFPIQEPILSNKIYDNYYFLRQTTAPLNPAMLPKTTPPGNEKRPITPTNRPTSPVTPNDSPVITLTVGRGLSEVAVITHKGQTVKVTASGVITVGEYVGDVTPTGTNVVQKVIFPVPVNREVYNIEPKFQHGSLLYRLSPTDSWELCGGKCSFESPQSGRQVIQFIVNDKNHNDNSGQFDLKLSVQ